ncbi:hypothetical protein LTR56_010931 [Elasticomyces elasticus]|nr:hypothetical protein LTR56_010931 [Elasticomyces elasticus]KAK3662630.1 hypothetical protein LTR22_006480 [Elasticomyces elasticus]KAK4926586.1 hypothetical protein LTR49_006520 [Elasticomyces elasticus]KAK5760679.1 hypothetical protein LTS12_009216 [Elasticomyces elasticus]
MSTTNSEFEESARLKEFHAKTIEITAKLSELESVLSTEVVKFAEYTVSSALLALSPGPTKTQDSKQPVAASSEESRNGTSDEFDESDESDCYQDSIGFGSEDQDKHFQACQQMREEILEDCIAVANKLHCGLKDILQQLQTEMKVVEGDLEEAEMLAQPDAHTFANQGNAFQTTRSEADFASQESLRALVKEQEAIIDAFRKKKAFATLEGIQAVVMSAYCTVIIAWIGLSEDTTPAIVELENWYDETPFKAMGCEPKYVFEGPQEESLVLARKIVSGHGASKTSCYKAADIREELACELGYE